MNRLEELLTLVNKVGDEETKNLIRPLVYEVVYLEEEIEKTKKLPFIKTHPTDPTRQKILPAHKVYVSLLQQYNNVIKNLTSIMEKHGVEETSPLRAYVQGLMKKAGG